MEEKVFYVSETIPEKEIPKKIEVHERSTTNNKDFGKWVEFTGRVFLYTLDRIEHNCPYYKDFMKVVYKKVKLI